MYFPRIFSLRWWSQWLFGQPRRRPRTRTSFLVGAVCAIELLESRELLAHDLGIEVAPQAAVPGQQVEIVATFHADSGNSGQRGSGDFVDYFGGVITAPTATTLDVPVDGVWVGNTFEVVGQDNGQAATQAFALDGSRQNETYFDSFLSENGGSGANDGFIHSAINLSDGRILYTGDSAGLVTVQQQTYWFSPGDARGEVGAIGGSQLRDASSTGIMIGFDQAAILRVPGGIHQNLPGFGANVARDISSDGTYIAGSLLWQINANGGYSVVDTSGFDFETSVEEPTWVGVEVDATGAAFFAGEFFDLNTFTSVVGFWAEDGTYLGSAGEVFADFAVVNGDVVAAVNGSDDGALVRVRDGQTVNVETLVGSKALFPAKGLFAKTGALGLVLQDAEGSFVTVVQTANQGGGDPPIVDLLFDCDGDGEIDARVENQNTGSLIHVYELAGTNTIEVIAVDQNGNEVARNTLELEVSPYVVVDVDGEQVLMIGANQQRGSTINVFGVGESLRLRVDRTSATVQADRVEIYGSDRSDRVTLFGSFDTTLNLGAGNDRLTSFGANVNADLGAGNDRGMVFNATNVSLFGGDGRDSLYSFNHDTALIDAGVGDDFVYSRGFASFIIGGADRDRIYAFDDYSVVVSGLLDYGTAEVDAVFAELGSGSPDFDFIGSILEPLHEDDGARDTGFIWGFDSLLLDGKKDRLWTFNRRR